MVGDPAAIVVAAAHAFGARDFDVKDALDAILAGATRPGTRCRAFETRPYLADYLEKGYVPQGPQESGHALWSAAVTLEYTSSDFAIAELARALGRGDLERAFLERAQNWRHLWDTQYGVIRPRDADGRFLEGFDPDRAMPYSPFSWDGQQGFIEGSARQYTWMVPYDLKGVIEAMGGREEAVRRLDVFFTKLRGGFRSPYFDISNEPSFGAPYAYDFAGVPSKTQALVRRILREEFHATPSGIPGNDDLGSMAAWYVWGAIGLYPGLPGTDVLLVGSPSFDRISIRLGDGRTLKVSGGRTAGEDWFVERLRRNGTDHGRPWLRRDELEGGSPTLQFSLRRSPTAWGGAPSDAPPSYDGPNRAEP
jgi:predicted alpha-1,2-mannosidase